VDAQVPVTGRALGVRTTAHRGAPGRGLDGLRSPSIATKSTRPRWWRRGRGPTKRFAPTSSVRGARSPGNPTSRRSPSPIAVRASIAPACSATSCRIAITRDFTSIAPSASSST
jgi:hypothetical protein